jgi:hypothetical protein
MKNHNEVGILILNLTKLLTRWTKTVDWFEEIQIRRKDIQLWNEVPRLTNVNPPLSLFFSPINKLLPTFFSFCLIESRGTLTTNCKPKSSPAQLSFRLSTWYLGGMDRRLQTRIVLIIIWWWWWWWTPTPCIASSLLLCRISSHHHGCLIVFETDNFTVNLHDYFNDKR